MDLLEVRNVTKNYVGHKALDDVSISVPQGKIYEIGRASCRERV